MKKIPYLVIVALIMCTINFSCKKEKDTASGPITLEYMVTPMNNDILQLTYRDTTGMVQNIFEPAQNPSQFPANGSLTFLPSNNIKGLNAMLAISIVKNTEDFRLQILVNGQVRKDSTIHSNDAVGGNITYKIP